MNFNLKIVLILFYFVLISSCAVRGYPPGGEEDTSPPELIKTNPEGNSKSISNTSIIEIWFDEMLNPNTVRSAIRVEPEVKYNVNIFGNKISVSPVDSWPEGMFKVLISRSLADYSSNMNTLDYPIELLFSTTDDFIDSKVEGKIFNSDSTKTYQAALLDNDFNIVSKTDVDINDYFKFSGFQTTDQNLFVFISEMKITDPLNDVRNKEYGMSQSYLDNQFQSIYISNPISRANINSINLKNDYYGEIVLNNNEKKSFIMNNVFFQGLVNQIDDFYYYDYNFLDSLNVVLEEENQLEKYIIDTKYMLASSLDTISPILDNHFVDEQSYLLEFNEPILFNDKKSFKSNNQVVNYKYITPLKIQLSISDFESIEITGSTIKDLSGNVLSDTILVIQKNILPNNVENYISGEINGTVNYNGKEDIFIQLISNSTKEVYRKKVNDNKFKFDDLKPDNYYILAYEDINKVSDNYFSGTLDPLKLSAKFSMYDKMVPVRSNWVNSIELKFE